MKLDDAKQLAKRLMDQHGLLPEWQFRFNRAKSFVGVCYNKHKRIELSRPFTELNSYAEIKDTLLHEIAHALIGEEHGHDDVWREKAKEIGAKPERTAAGRVINHPKEKWIGDCGCSKRRYRYRLVRDRQLVCKRCTEVVKWRLR
jgi:predicted SprT family Zn-dependent metalloprotease